MGASPARPRVRYYCRYLDIWRHANSALVGGKMRRLQTALIALNTASSMIASSGSPYALPRDQHARHRQSVLCSFAYFNRPSTCVVTNQVGHRRLLRDQVSQSDSERSPGVRASVTTCVRCSGGTSYVISKTCGNTQLSRSLLISRSSFGARASTVVRGSWR